MKSRKYNKFRKHNKKTYKKYNKKTYKKTYKKSEKKVKKIKHNRKTYKKNKKGGGDDLCVSTEDKPCCLYESNEDPQQGLNQKCNEYYFEEILPSRLHNYYSWRNPNNLLTKSNSCKKVNIKNKFKRCPKSLHDKKKQERRDLEAKAHEEERIREEQIRNEDNLRRAQQNEKLLDTLGKMRDEDNLRRAQQNEELLHNVGKMRDRSSYQTKKISMTSKPNSDSRTRKNSLTKSGNNNSNDDNFDALDQQLYPALQYDQQEISLDYK